MTPSEFLATKTRDELLVVATEKDDTRGLFNDPKETP